MRKAALFLLGLVLFVGAAGVFSSPTTAGAGLPLVGAQDDVANAASPPIVSAKCIVVFGQRVCFEDDRRGGNKNKSKKGEASNAGERSCPPGYVVLDKPNKYGAFCEPKEGFPESKPQQAKVCGFGMNGNPPNCWCSIGNGPLRGYRGCPTSYNGWPSTEVAAMGQKEFFARCPREKSLCRKASKPGVVFECYCYEASYNPDGTKR